MHILATPLKPLSSVTLSKDEGKILTWLRSADWKPEAGAREPVPFKAKVPEFYSGVRLYSMQGGTSSGSMSPLALFIKKLEHQGVIKKQGIDPVAGHGGARFLLLTKLELDNLGVGRGGDDEDE